MFYRSLYIVFVFHKNCFVAKFSKIFFYKEIVKAKKMTVEKKIIEN